MDKSAAQLEGEGTKEITIDFQGFKVTVPADIDDWPIAAMQAAQGGRAIDALAEVLGRRKWGALNRKFKRAGDVIELFNQIIDAMGLEDSGN